MDGAFTASAMAISGASKIFTPDHSHPLKVIQGPMSTAIVSMLVKYAPSIHS
jgi:hypothetical protein